MTAVSGKVSIYTWRQHVGECYQCAVHMEGRSVFMHMCNKKKKRHMVVTIIDLYISWTDIQAMPTLISNAQSKYKVQGMAILKYGIQ